MASAMDSFGNPSSVHAEGRSARAVVEKARIEVADAIGIDPFRIVFTSGSTEAAALGLAGQQISSAMIEHDSVLAWTDPVLPVLETGRVQVDDPASSTLQVANGETGIVQNLPAGIRLTDATQAFGKIEIGEQLGKAEMALISSHKIGGPKGVGALIVGENMEVEAILRGGGQEFGRRSGTENVIGIAGFGAAAATAARNLAEGIFGRVKALRDMLESALSELVREITIFGADSRRLPNTSCFAVPDWKAETQVMLMDLEGFSVSAGSACSSGKVARSRVLEALGVPGPLADSAIRVSIGPATTEKQLLAFAKVWTNHYIRYQESKTMRSVRPE